MQHYTNLGDMEAETVALAAPIRSGTMHRFFSDEAIELHCSNCDMINALVLPTGEVTAWCLHTGERYQIGWSA